MRAASRYQYTKKEKYYDFKTGKKIKLTITAQKAEITNQAI